MSLVIFVCNLRIILPNVSHPLKMSNNNKRYRFQGYQSGLLYAG